MVNARRSVLRASTPIRFVGLLSLWRGQSHTNAGRLPRLAFHFDHTVLTTPSLYAMRHARCSQSSRNNVNRAGGQSHPRKESVSS